MKPPDFSGLRELVRLAAIHAAMAARWEASDFSNRFRDLAVPDLLRARAAGLARSGAGRDQLLSLALAAAADDLQHGRAPLGAGALFWSEAANDPAERLRIQREVLALSGSADVAADALALHLEAEHRRDVGPGGVATRLVRDARLHKRLWDDPRLRADARTRLVMLCSVPRLMDRARSLDPLRLGGVVDLIKGAGILPPTAAAGG